MSERQTAQQPVLTDFHTMQVAVANCARPHHGDAEGEMASRALARRHLLDYTTYTYPRYQPEPVHWLIADQLTRVLNGDIRKLIIVAPPQHGKSELVSVRFPVFWLSHRPHEPVIISSYGAKLAGDKAFEAKQVLAQAEHATLFPNIRPSPLYRSTVTWRLDGFKGGVESAGVGGPITGYGAGLGIIDDPIKNFEQAFSSSWRQRVWDWYRTTFRTRIWETGSIVIIMTRWHEDDLAGRLLADQPGEWVVLRLPALAESQVERDSKNSRMNIEQNLPDPLSRKEGEPLAPRRFSANILRELKRDVGSYGWDAEYQGSPTSREGTLFKREWFTNMVDAAPREGIRVRYWDKAGTVTEQASWTSGTLVCYHDGRWYIEDVVRGKWEYPEREKIIKQTAERDASLYGDHGVTIWLEQEPGSGGKESADSTIRNLGGYIVRKEPVRVSTEVRWVPMIVQFEAGNVSLVRGRWNWDFIEEGVAAGPGVNSDQIDSAAGAFNKTAPRARAKVRSLSDAED